MYFYIFDSFTQKPKYAKISELLSFKLTNLGIFTNKARATALKPLEILARSALLEKKYKNVIAVGDDRSANLVINEIMKSRDKVTFGFIPIGESKIAKMLGMPNGVEAASVIAARKIEKIDLGRLDHSYFLSQLELLVKKRETSGLYKFLNKLVAKKLPQAEVSLEDKFKIKAEAERIVIANLLFEEDRKLLEKFNIKIAVSPTDGLFDIFVFTKGKNKAVSVLRSKDIKIKTNQSLCFRVDNQDSKRFFNRVSLKPQALSVIVGKERKF